MKITERPKNITWIKLQRSVSIQNMTVFDLQAILTVTRSAAPQRHKILSRQHSTSAELGQAIEQELSWREEHPRMHRDGPASFSWFSKTYTWETHTMSTKHLREALEHVITGGAVTRQLYTRPFLERSLRSELRWRREERRKVRQERYDAAFEPNDALRQAHQALSGVPLSYRLTGVSR